MMVMIASKIEAMENVNQTALIFHL